MIYRKEKTGRLKAFFSHKAVISLIGFFLLVLIVFPLSKNLVKRYNIDKELKELEAEIARLENRNSDLGGMVAYLESDRFIDEQARSKLNYKKTGEELVVIKNNSEDLSSENSNTKTIMQYEMNRTENAKKEERNNFNNWYYYFFKRME